MILHSLNVKPVTQEEKHGCKQDIDLYGTISKNEFQKRARA